jgi:DnaJ family protein B protein 4
MNSSHIRSDQHSSNVFANDSTSDSTNTGASDSTNTGASANIVASSVSQSVSANKCTSIPTSTSVSSASTSATSSTRGVLLVSCAITATCLITGATATKSNPAMDMGMRVGMGREGVINGSGSISGSINDSLHLPFTAKATATTGTQTTNKKQSQPSTHEESMLWGISRGGHNNKNNNNNNSNNSNNSSTKNRNHKSNKEDEINENIEKTKLSFSAISQTEKKTRKVKKKKKKLFNYKSTTSDGSAAGANAGAGAGAEDSTYTSKKEKSQPPPPPPPPPPLPKEKKTTTSKSYTSSTKTSTSSSSSSSQQKPSQPSSKEAMINQILSTKDYYKILNISKSTSTTLTSTQITKAYRKQAVITHPDKNNGNREAFDKVREAYDVIKDDVKRKVYDKYGLEGIQNPELYAAATSRFGNMFGSSAQGSAASAGSNLHEQLFKNFFGTSPSGGMFGNQFHSSSSSSSSRSSRQRQEPTNQNIKYELQVSLEDLYNGKEYNLEILLPSHATPTSASTSRYASKTRKIVQVEIPRGAKNQQSIRLSGYIDTISTATPADLIFVIKQKHHPIYTRKGFDLAMEIKISFKEALCGFDREIVHLDGRKIKISNPYFVGDDDGVHSQRKNGLTMIQSGDVHVLKGEGMPKFNWVEKKSSHDDGDGDHEHDHDEEVNKQYGDLYIQYTVDMPSTSTSNNRRNDADVLSPDERETLGELLDKLYGTKKEQYSSSESLNIDDNLDKLPRRLQLSSASNFGKASGTSSQFDSHDDDHEGHLADADDYHNNDHMFGFGRDGFHHHQQRRYGSSTGTSSSSFFSRGFGSGFAGGDDDGNVQCHQM